MDTDLPSGRSDPRRDPSALSRGPAAWLARARAAVLGSQYRDPQDGWYTTDWMDLDRLA